MANLILTTDCQNECDYCFAKEDRNSNAQLRWGDFLYLVDILSKGKLNIVNLLGGEPTLHPDFSRMLDYLIKSGFAVQIFTNGKVSEGCISEIEEVLNGNMLVGGQVVFAVNVSLGERAFKEQELFFDRMGSVVYPSFTITDPEVDLCFLVDLVNNYKLERFIKLSLAMPIALGDNKYLSERDYPKVAKSIHKLIDKLDDMKLIFDCGFPMCIFSEGKSMSEVEARMKDGQSFICGQPLDIHPDLTVTNCYPLSKLHKVKVEDFKGIDEIEEYFRAGFIMPFGIYRNKCAKCKFFRRMCSGGCKGFYLVNNNS